MGAPIDLVHLTHQNMFWAGFSLFGRRDIGLALSDSID
jgi:hypothetical protein